MAVEVIAFSVHKLLSLRIHTIHTYESTHNGGLFIMAFCALKIIYLFPSLLRLKGIPNKRASLWLDGMLSKLMYVAVNCVMEDDALTHSRNRSLFLVIHHHHHHNNNKANNCRENQQQQPKLTGCILQFGRSL